MEKVKLKFTVLFEIPFWIGIYELEFAGKYEVCKVFFGAEPNDSEVYDFFLKNWNKFRFDQSLEAEKIVDNRINPKRLQRIIKNQLKKVGIGTKAQEALKIHHEQRKLEHKSCSQKQREMEKRRKFELRQEKRKEKHKGH